MRASSEVNEEEDNQDDDRPPSSPRQRGVVDSRLSYDPPHQTENEPLPLMPSDGVYGPQSKLVLLEAITALTHRRWEEQRGVVDMQLESMRKESAVAMDAERRVSPLTDRSRATSLLSSTIATWPRRHSPQAREKLHETLSERITLSEQAKGDIKRQLDDSELQNTKWAEEKVQLGRQVAESNDKHTKLQAHLGTVTDENESFRAKIVLLRKQLASSERTKAELGRVLGVDKTNLRTANDTHRREMEEAKRARTALEEQLGKANSNAAAHKAKSVEVQQRLYEQEESHAKALFEIEEELELESSELRRRLAKSQSSNKLLRSEAVANQETNHTLERRLVSKQREIEVRREEETRLEQELVKVQTELSESNADRDRVKTQLVAAQKAITGFEEDNAALRRNFESNKRKLDELKVEYDDVERRWTELRTLFSRPLGFRQSVEQGRQ